jgi:gentisate 1,2-dioxygenase
MTWALATALRPELAPVQETVMHISEQKRVGDQSRYEQRARYLANENGFAFSYPPVPAHQFKAEYKRAVDSRAPTGPIMLDGSDTLDTAYPATTPTLLCRYLRVRAGERFSVTYVASGEVSFVMSGRGESTNGADSLSWRQGDVFCLPGGVETTYRADADTLLFNVTDEPLLAFAGARAPEEGRSSVEAVVWRSKEIERHLEAVYQRAITNNTTGSSVQFSTRRTEPNYTTIPFINVAMNTLAAGCDQRPHRHNGVAVTLAIQGEGIHSLIEGERIEWVTGVAQVTPATALHSHHNRGEKRMRSLVIQDEGLHVYTRTPGFSFD